MDLINDGSAVNLSTGKLTTFIDFAKYACEILGINPKIQGTKLSQKVFSQEVEMFQSKKV